MFDIHNSLLRVTIILIAYLGCSSAVTQQLVDVEANPDEEITLENIYLRSMNGSWSQIPASHEFRAFPKEEVVEFIEEKLDQIPVDDDSGRHYCYYALFATQAAEIPGGRRLLLEGLDDPKFGGIAAQGLFYTPTEAIDEVRPALLAAAQRPGVDPYQAQQMLQRVRMFSLEEEEPDEEMLRIATSLFNDADRSPRVRSAAIAILISHLDVPIVINMIKEADDEGMATGLHALLGSTIITRFKYAPLEDQKEVRRQIIRILIESLQWDAPIDKKTVLTGLSMRLGDYRLTDDPDQLEINRAVYEAIQGIDLEQFDDFIRDGFVGVLDRLKPHLNPVGTTGGFVSSESQEADTGPESSRVSSLEIRPAPDAPSARAVLEEAKEPTTVAEGAPSEEPQDSGWPRGMLVVSICAFVFLLTFTGYRVFLKKGRTGS